MLDPVSPEALEAEATAMQDGGWRNVPTLLRRAALTIRELQKKRRDLLASIIVNGSQLSEYDAVLGALLRQVWEHPESCVLIKTTDDYTCTLTVQGLQKMLDHLDSLRPKESEPAPSGARYRFALGFLESQTATSRLWYTVSGVPLEDVAFVAKLVEGANDG